MTDKTSKPIDLIGQLYHLEYECAHCGTTWGDTWNEEVSRPCPKCGTLTPAAKVESITAQLRHRMDNILDGVQVALLATHACTGDDEQKRALIKLLTLLRKYMPEERCMPLPEALSTPVPQPVGDMTNMDEDDVRQLGDHVGEMFTRVAKAIRKQDERLALVACIVAGVPTFALSFVDALPDGEMKVTPLFAAITEDIQVAGPDGTPALHDGGFPGHTQLH